MNNYRDFTRICRVCMSDGSRDIFHKNAPSPIPSTSTGNIPSTSPLDRLLEKLRYVTMMKIEESDDLPRLLCDLCIVQLNVAYNFKRQAVENDTRLRQYFIEHGITSNNTSTNNNINNNVMYNENQNSTRSTLTVSNVSSMPPVNRSFPIVPFVIKTEPSDNDALSDYTTEIHLDTNSRIGRFTPSIPTSTPGHETIGGSSDSGIDVFNKDKNNSSVVYINGYAYKNFTPSSDIEYPHNYHHQSPLNNSSSSSSQKQQQQRQQQQQQHHHQQTSSSLNTETSTSTFNQQENTDDGINNKIISAADSSRSSNKLNSNQNQNPEPVVKLSPTTSKTLAIISNKSTLLKTNTSGTSIKQRTRKGKEKRELENLSIDMTLPIGKRRRTVDLTRTSERNQIAVTSSNKNNGNRLIKKETINNLNNTSNSYNNNNKITNKIQKPKAAKTQKNLLINLDKVSTSSLKIGGRKKSTLITPTATNATAPAVASTTTSAAAADHKLLINPYFKNETKKLKRKRLYNEGRLKEKTLTKFIEPKLEPTGK